MTVFPMQALVVQTAELARQLQQQMATAAVDEALSELLAAAVNCVPGAAHGAITLGNRDGAQAVAVTGGCPAAVGDIQRRHKGVCRSSEPLRDVIRIDDVTTERRWSRYCREVADETPIRSIIAIPLFADRHHLAVLSFYAERPHAFSESVEPALMAATHIALAWNMLRHDEQFHRALESRDLIGQAKGILMERFNIGHQQAFDLLSRLSQNSNTAVGEIARRLVEKEGPAHDVNALG